MSNLAVGSKNDYESLLVFNIRQMINSAKALPQICSDLKRRFTCAMYSNRKYVGEDYYFDEGEYDGYDEWEHDQMERRKARTEKARQRYDAYKSGQEAERIGAVLRRDTRRRVEELYQGDQMMPSVKTIDFSVSRHEAVQEITQPINVRAMSYANYMRSFVLVITTPFDEMVRQYMRNGGWDKLIQRKNHSERHAARQSETALQAVDRTAVEDKTGLSFTNIRKLSKAFKITQKEGIAMCEELVNTIYHGHDWRHRKISEIDEARLLELMDDYANASQNEDVDFLCSCVHDASRGIMIREAIFIGLTVRDANPATLKKLALQQATNGASA